MTIVWKDKEVTPVPLPTSPSWRSRSGSPASTIWVGQQAGGWQGPSDPAMGFRSWHLCHLFPSTCQGSCPPPNCLAVPGPLLGNSCGSSPALGPLCSVPLIFQMKQPTICPFIHPTTHHPKHIIPMSFLPGAHWGIWAAHMCNGACTVSGVLLGTRY
jgi:hypothetical protein